MPSPWAESALRAEIDRVRSTGEGGRNAALNRAAYALGQLVAGGELDRAQVEPELVAAGIAIGLPQREVEAVVRRSLSEGAKQPRTAPELTNGRPRNAKNRAERRPVARAATNPRPPAPPPKRPPVEEVRALWEACVPVTEDAEVRRWLEAERRQSAESIAEHDLARALPKGKALPDWAALGPEGKPDKARSWFELGYRCIVPLYDSSGALVNLRARNVDPKRDPKAIPPTRAHCDPPERYTGGLVGSVMACPIARHILATGEAPPWQNGATLRIIVEEGEPNYLRAVLRWGATTEADCPPAVFGIMSGSWGADPSGPIASRIPSGARVTIRTDHDDQGEGYARKIRTSLEGRCTVLRTRPTA